jgi:glycosyltransferase involved in cell wall biosynthesis
MKEENTQPILSISLLCSGRNKEEMVKTLDSLMSIRNRMLSEIVIVDTGCGPDTKPLLWKYADQVVPFTWCDDFAKARNAGLERCTGEWFMFVDDDESFENTDAIVDFFNSGEYKEYGRAEYKIRNYTRFDGSLYEDTWSARIVKKVDNLIFWGKVHEYLKPVGGKVKRLDSFVHHYGYAYVNREAKFRKAYRNIPLIQDMLKEEPDNPHWRTQLIQEYRNIADYSDMESLCRSSLEQIKDINSAIANNERASFYEGVLLPEMVTYRFDEVIADAKSFLEDKRNSEKCNTGLLSYMVKAYSCKKDYQHTYIYAQRYLESYQHFSQIEDVSVNDMTFMCGNVFSHMNIQYCISRIIYAGIKCGNISAIYDYFDMFDLEEKGEQAKVFTEGVINAFAEFDYDSRFIDYAKKLCKHGLLLALSIQYISEIEKKSIKKFEKLVRVFGQTGCFDDPYMIYLRLLYAYRYDDSILEETYRILFGCVVDPFDMDEKTWEIAAEAHIDIASIIKTVPFTQWKRGVNTFFEKKSDSKEEIIDRINCLSEQDDDIRFQYFRLKAEEMKVTNAGADVERMIVNYCTDCVNFYLEIYRADLFTGDTTILPDECRFAMSFIKTVSNENSFTPLEYIKELEQCAAIYDHFAKAMKAYIGKVGEKKKKELLQSL